MSWDRCGSRTEKLAVRFVYVNIYCAVLSRSVMSDFCDPMDCSPPGSSAHGDSPGQDTGMVCHFLLQGIFPTQGLNPGLPHCRRILYHLSHQGIPTMDYTSRTLTPGWLGCEEEYLQVTVMAK